MAEADEVEALFRAYAPAVHAFAQRRLDDPERAWDIVSETLIVVCRKNIPELPLSWLYAIAGNAVRNANRGHRRGWALTRKVQQEHVPGASPDPAVVVEARSRPALVRQALQSLTPADQEVLRLIACEELDLTATGTAPGQR